MKKVQSCADIARRDREMAEADTSGRSEEKREKQVKFPTFYTVQAKEILEENGKAEQQPLNQSEQNPEKKTSALQIFQRRGHVGFRRLTDFNDLSRSIMLWIVV